MALATCGNDALKIKVGSTETKHLAALGTIPGVVPLLVSATNGSGTAFLKSDGTRLSWLAPGSNTFGLEHDCIVDGAYILHDGEDTSKWVRVQVYVDHLHLTPVQDDVILLDVYDNDVGSDDVTTAEATAGDVETYIVTLENVSNDTLTQITFWIDSATAGITISDDNVTFVSSTTQATGLQFADLLPTGTATLYVRRTITAGADSDPDVLTHLHSHFCGYIG